MTRVNIGIPPSELCDQHLLAEYRELPRVFAVDPKGAPALPCLGKGHVKWCATKPGYMSERFSSLVTEMRIRGFRLSYEHAPPADRSKYRPWRVEELRSFYAIADIIRARIVERLGQMKRKPTWTNRERPAWAEVTQ